PVRGCPWLEMEVRARPRAVLEIAPRLPQHRPRHFDDLDHTFSPFGGARLRAAATRAVRRWRIRRLLQEGGSGRASLHRATNDPFGPSWLNAVRPGRTAELPWCQKQSRKLLLLARTWGCNPSVSARTSERKTRPSWNGHACGGYATAPRHPGTPAPR